MKISALMLCVTLFVTSPLFADGDAATMFKNLKTLAGTWQGRMTTTPKMPDVDGTQATVTLRVTSMGHVLMHEMVGEGRPDDPITMLYLDDAKLALTHFCDAGNRPRMTAKLSEDGKSVEFDFLDVSGPLKYGHMRKAKFTFVDADTHIEEWTFMRPGDKAVVARAVLTRVGPPPAAPVATAEHKH